MDQTGTTTTAPQPQQDGGAPETAPDGVAAAVDDAGALSSEPPGFQSRGRARRRVRFLRKARELAYRDLGGLVFNLHRFGQRHDALVLAKLTTLAQIDGELRAIERAIGERQPITVLREAGITACPRCAAIHSSEDSFCPNCGMSMGRHADLPIAGAPAPPAPARQPSSPSTPPAPAPQQPSPVAAAPVPQPAAPAAVPLGAREANPATAPVAAARPTSSADPPAPAGAEAPSEAAADDGATEIIRPPASGS